MLTVQPDVCLETVNLPTRGLKFINLACLFEDKSVISIIPGYFENKDSSIFCC